MNYLIIIFEILLTAITIFLSNKYYKKNGLYIFIIIMTIITVLTITKRIIILGVSINTGIIPITSIIFTSNILIQKYGNQEKNKLLLMELILIVTIILTLLLTTGFNPNINEYHQLFNFDIRLLISSMISLILSLYLNFNIYYEIKKKHNKVIINNISSIMLTMVIESITFILLTYSITENIDNIIMMIIIRYVIMVITGISYTPILYYINKTEVISK